MAIYKKITELVGNTPLLELTGYEKKEKLEAKIYAKLEFLNPAGSVKDRIAKAMIEKAPGFCHHRADQRQYGNRSGGDRRLQGLPRHFDDAGDDERGTPHVAESLWCRNCVDRGCQRNERRH